MIISLLLLVITLMIAPSAHAWTTTLPPVPPADNVMAAVTATALSSSSSSSSSSSQLLSLNIQDWLFQQHSLGVPPAFAADTAVSPPSKEDIALLRQAFASFYGTGRDYTVALDLLSKAIEAWQGQPPDEQAGLYRVRGDCQLALLQAQPAIQDYSKALELLQLDQSSSSGAPKADPAELPAAYLGRARAIRALHTTASPTQRQMAVDDYAQALKLSAREEWDTEQDLLEDGARTNPYATWEYGMALRLNQQFADAKAIHILAAEDFEDIGDRARSVISTLDAGIDAAALSSSSSSPPDQAMTLLKQGIAKTKTVEGRDIPLLQRVIAKEGEARMALASVAWTSGDRPEAEKQLGLACERLDQLEADAIQRNKFNPPVKQPEHLLFNIDDGVGALDISCTRLRNKEYLTERLEWPSSLQEKVGKLYSLAK